MNLGELEAGLLGLMLQGGHERIFAVIEAWHEENYASVLSSDSMLVRRRKYVAARLIAGWTQKQIAEALNVKPQLIKDDRAALKRVLSSPFSKTITAGRIVDADDAQ